MSRKKDPQHEPEDAADYRYALDEAAMVAMTDARGVILQVNANFCKLIGYSREELIGRDQSLLYSDCHTKHFIKAQQAGLAAGKIWKGKQKYRNREGQCHWLSSSIVPIPGKDGKPAHYFSISEDITEEENTREQLRVTQAYLKSSIESYKDVLIFSIDTQFRYLLFNQAFKAATEAAYGTVIKEGMSVLESITSEEDREKVRLNCAVALAGEAHTTVEVYGNLNKIYYETKYSPITDEQQQIIGVTVLSANVTERKQAEEQILALNKELEAFSYSVAHDLRAPLRSVDGYAQMLQEDYEAVLNDEGKRIIEVIKSNAAKMGTLIDDLLAFSRLGRKELKKTVVDMNALTEAVIYDIEKDTKHNAKIVQGNLHPVQGDYGLLYQVMFNFISNAVKYSSKKKAPLIEISSEEKEHELVFSIKDNGAGFDMKYYDKLFGIFQRLHLQDEFEGTGLGLAIVQRIIHKHGGKVWAEAKEGEGATFFFMIPGAAD